MTRLIHSLMAVLLMALSGATWAQLANDPFAAAITLSGNATQSTGSNVGATSEPGEPVHAGVGGGASVWWQWTASASLVTTIDTFGSNFDTVLAVYTGNTVNALTTIGSNDDAGSGLQSQVRFTAVAGTTYRIAVDGFAAARGNIVLNLLSADPAPVLSSNPAGGATVSLPGGALGSTSVRVVDLIASAGSGASSVALACVSSGDVLIGAAGGTPGGNSFTQTVNAGAQPQDLAVAAVLTETLQTLPNAVVCTATPSAGASYTLSYTVRRPAALAANSPPVISSIPPSGSTLHLQAAALGGLATGSLDLRLEPGLGSGTAAVACSGDAGLQIAAAGQPPAPGQFAQTVPANGPVIDVSLGAPTVQTPYTLSLLCSVTPSVGNSYALIYTVSVPAGLVPGSQTWVPIGPGPVADGQSEGIVGPPANAVSGAVQVVLPHPVNAEILYAGSVNGGVWRTDNAQAPSPNWRPLTDQQDSLSIGALVFDAGDPNILVAGIGRFSSFGRVGGATTGLLRSSDGGSSWSPLASSMRGRNISGLAVNGSVIVAASNGSANGLCTDRGLFRSTDGGASFVQIGAAQGFAPGLVTALTSDQSAPQTLYAHLDGANDCQAQASANGIYRSSDGGASWQKVSSPEMNTLMASSGKVVRVQAIGGRVAVGISDGQLRGVFYSTDAGASWTLIGFPQTFEDGDAIGIHPGGQGRLHFSLALDRSNPNLIYIGGDRQPGDFPNSLGANDFSGRLFRGDGTAPGGNWMSLTHSGTANNSAPHADSRSLAMDAAGRLIEGDDGGVYARLQPGSAAGSWISLNGDLQVTEQHNVAFDRIAGVALSGNQDNGSMRQLGSTLRDWVVISGGDGGDVAVDALQAAESGAAISYASSQFLGGFSRREYSAANAALTLSFPELIGTDGSTGPEGQFVTPIASNRIVGNRLVIGGSDGLYESFDSGDTVARIADGLRARSPLGANSIAYGAEGNADVLYVAGCNGSCTEGNDDGLFVRTALGAALVLSRANVGQQEALAVTVDRGNPAQAFALLFDPMLPGVLLRTTNTGASWEDITGDLPASTVDLHSLRHIETPAGDALVVGTNTGVYIAAESQGYRSWTRLGEGLPKALVSDLDYDPVRNLLIAGTMGRGSHKLSLPRLKANPGWSGVWYDPAFDGQGFQFDVIPESETLVVAWYTHTPDALPRTRSNLTWFTGAGVLANGVANVSLVRSRGTFDAPTNFLEQAGNLRVRFVDCRHAVLEYDLNVGGNILQGSTSLQRLSSDAVCESYRTLGDAAITTLAPPAAANRFQYGMTGTWYNPVTDGQGMLLEYYPQEQLLLAGWYTYDFTDTSPQGAQPPLWMTALGPVNGNSATLQVTLTRGGGFVAPTPVTSTNIGTLTINATDCTHVTASYSLTIDGQLRTGQFPMQRLTSSALCRQPLAAP